MQWAKLSLPNISVSYSDGNIPAVDRAVLSSCDHIVSTVGTFSWWSAWLIGDNVTHYKLSTKEGTPIRQHVLQRLHGLYLSSLGRAMNCKMWEIKLMQWKV